MSEEMARVLAALKPGHGLPELPTTQAYERLCDMPPRVLATRVVESLIRCKGDLNEYAKVIEALIVNMRDELRHAQCNEGDGNG